MTYEYIQLPVKISPLPTSFTLNTTATYSGKSGYATPQPPGTPSPCNAPPYVNNSGFTFSVIASPTPTATPRPTATPTPTPKPTAAPTASCTLAGITKSVHDILATDSHARGLLGAIAAANGSVAPNVTTDSLRAGLAASTTVAAGFKVGQPGVIDFPDANVSAAVGDGQEAYQILDHELGHLFYQTGAPGARPNPLPGEPGFDSSPTVTLTDGLTMTFDISAAKGGTLSDGYDGYEHAMIHDDLVNAYPKIGDTTGALAEALREATKVTKDGKVLTFPNYAAAKAEADHHSLVGIKSGRVAKRPPATGKFDGCEAGGKSPAERIAPDVSPTYLPFIDKYWIDPYE